jgi:rubrerythrin
VLQHYDKANASPITKSHILTLMAGEQQTWNFYKTNGNMYGTPELRQLYAEISEVEEEHVTQYESLIDPNETLLEKWVMHEFNEVANYYTCYQTEIDPRIKPIWEQFLSYELEHLRIAGEMLKQHENKDPQEICGVDLPTPATFETNREYVRNVLEETVKMRLVAGGDWKQIDELPSDWSSYEYQQAMNGDNAASEAVVAMRIGSAGAELVRTGDDGFSSSAGKYRTETLDAGEAPNTVAANGQNAPSMEEEKMRLGELADQVENVTLGGNGRSGRKSGNGARAGQGTASASRSTRKKA